MIEVKGKGPWGLPLVNVDDFFGLRFRFEFVVELPNHILSHRRDEKCWNHGGDAPPQTLELSVNKLHCSSGLWLITTNNKKIHSSKCLNLNASGCRNRGCTFIYVWVKCGSPSKMRPIRLDVNWWTPAKPLRL